MFCGKLLRRVGFLYFCSFSFPFGFLSTLLTVATCELYIETSFHSCHKRRGDIRSCGCSSGTFRKASARLLSQPGLPPAGTVVGCFLWGRSAVLLTPERFHGRLCSFSSTLEYSARLLVRGAGKGGFNVKRGRNLGSVSGCQTGECVFGFSVLRPGARAGTGPVEAPHC